MTSGLTVHFVLNGIETEIQAEPHWTLQYVLREKFGLTGVKNGCETGECGACTVLLDDKAVTSCIILIGDVENHRITTIEGISKDGEPCALQKAFIDVGAIQCGYCTPGMIMSAYALLLKNPHPTREEIIEGISGNICRCTGYEQIIKAIELVQGGKY